jgi:hypothetical protein
MYSVYMLFDIIGVYTCTFFVAYTFAIRVGVELTT